MEPSIRGPAGLESQRAPRRGWTCALGRNGRRAGGAGPFCVLVPGSVAGGAAMGYGTPGAGNGDVQWRSLTSLRSLPRPGVRSTPGEGGGGSPAPEARFRSGSCAPAPGGRGHAGKCRVSASRGLGTTALPALPSLLARGGFSAGEGDLQEARLHPRMRKGGKEDRRPPLRKGQRT